MPEDSEYIEKEFLLRNTKFIKDVTGTFKVEFSSYIEELEQTNNEDTIYYLLHQMEGVAVSLRAMKLYSTIVHNKKRLADDLISLPEVLVFLRADFDHLISYLENLK